MFATSSQDGSIIVWKFIENNGKSKPELGFDQLISIQDLAQKHPILKPTIEQDSVVQQLMIISY
jgi:hypothetical protein